MEYRRSNDDLDNISADSSDNKCFSGTTKLVLNDELKELVKKTIITDAQNINSPFYLSNITIYGVYHDQLLRFMQNINPHFKASQTDNLAFVLLLTYPIEMIDSFLSFQDLNLSFRNNNNVSDFTDVGFKCISYENEETCLHTCICNERLANIYVFENNFTNIRFQLGCDCVLRHKLLDKNDPNYVSNGKKIKEYRKMEKDRMEEREKGLPDGFLKLERIRLKEEKLLLKEQKDKEIIDKQVFEKNNKLVNQKKGIQYCSNNCQLCNKYCIMDSKSKRRLCSTCLKRDATFIKSQKLVMEQLLKKYFYLSYILFCVCCGKDFISKNIHSQLCKDCDAIYRIYKCKLCKGDYIDDKFKMAETDVYCEDCDKKSSKCIDCKIVKFTEYNRCNDCFKKKANIKNISNNKNTYTKVKLHCQMKDCDKTFEINECDKKWKKNCDECYKKIKKEKVNCITCSNSFERNNCDTWKKRCPSCYDKYK